MTTGRLAWSWTQVLSAKFDASKQLQKDENTCAGVLPGAWPMSKLMLFKCTALESSQHTADRSTEILLSAWWMFKVPEN